MRRLMRAIGTVAAVLLLAPGCVAEVDDQGPEVPVLVVGAETQGDMGFDPDDCGLTMVFPGEELDDDFGIGEKIATTYEKATSHPIFRIYREEPGHPGDTKGDLADQAGQLGDICDAHGICSIMEDEYRTVDPQAGEMMTLDELCEQHGVCGIEVMTDHGVEYIGKAMTDAGQIMTVDELCEQHGVCGIGTITP